MVLSNGLWLIAKQTKLHKSVLYMKLGYICLGFLDLIQKIELSNCEVLTV